MPSTARMMARTAIAAAKISWNQSPQAASPEPITPNFLMTVMTRLARLSPISSALADSDQKMTVKILDDNNVDYMKGGENIATQWGSIYDFAGIIKDIANSQYEELTGEERTEINVMRHAVKNMQHKQGGEGVSL